MDEIEIWRAAKQMIELHGPDAKSAALARAVTMRGQGSEDGFHVWNHIAARIADLGRQKPSPSETLD
ncbi:MAG TPA: hypothetical protein VHV26_10245 [Rhizomicrobium sp.]|jgi:hypothetical protein|nr:hypothetical protein [Rhizomicrobium sp.]